MSIIYGINLYMKIGVIIPTRNDRPLFEANCLRMILSQTIKPDIIEVIDNPPETQDCDITWRYKIGYDKLRNKNIDVIFLMENDDFYSSNYIETMLNNWILNGKPDLFGTNYTIYYHLKLKAYFQMNHTLRSSAMSTMIKPDLNFPWCANNEPYTDMHLWNLPGLKRITFNPGKHICIGMKHGEGLCGGRSHVDRLHRYQDPKHAFQDADSLFLKQNLDADSFLFYSNYFSNGTSTV